jgi:hypothetical protein
VGLAIALWLQHGKAVAHKNDADYLKHAIDQSGLELTQMCWGPPIWFKRDNRLSEPDNERIIFALK